MCPVTHPWINILIELLLIGQSECRCGNEQCEAFNQYVVHKHGMQDFDLMQDKAECPMCKTAGQAATCAFLGCAYSFSGQKRAHSAGQWESVRGDWTVCAANTYTRFNETCDDSMVEWRRLMICVRPTPDGQSLDLVSSSKIGPPQPCEGVKSSEGDVVQPYTRLCGQMDLLMLVDLDCACAICLEDMRPDTTASPVQVRTLPVDSTGERAGLLA